MFSKSIVIILGCVISGILAAPAEVPPEKLQPTVIPIVAQSDELEANGTYKFSYETGNGIIREETAYEKVLPSARDASSSEGGEDDEGDSNEIHVQRGSYSYTAPDGTVISVSYIADENGFQPIGDHLPRSPVLALNSNSAEKLGRSLKIADSSESASATAKVVKKPTESANQNTKENSGPVPTNFEDKQDESKPRSASISEVEDAKTESISASTTEENTLNSVSSSATEQNEPTSLPIEVAPEAEDKLGVSNTEPAAEAKSAVLDEQSMTEAQVITAGTTESSEDKINVDVSTEAASTAASAQSTTESEQGSTALTYQASTSTPESSTSSEASEQTSSTSAPESTSSSEVVGQSTSTEAANQSPTEETGLSSAHTTESSTTEQPTTPIAA
ncbi:jg9519 [Pararge aegeria aegeria]|uniref:Jg9519 protein n=1 Tax=Pararge aegeria aegeria TaxID=348720 RepID=A0A8S4RJQ1_9NEOP|nr:jg9519 [Pararge aegeria aegeria]